MPRVCECCGQDVPPKLSLVEYEKRAIPRLAAIDRLAQKIDFASWGWELTSDGERYKRLMDEQGQDESDAGL